MQTLALRSAAISAIFLLTAPGSAHAAASITSTPISIMTYNVHGLPWPLASGRSEAFEAMIKRLRALRRAGEQPHIIVLQEAFTSEAQSIGRRSGYPFVVRGPAANDRSPIAATARDRAFALNASFLSGETSGKYLGSGLQILSDFPILATRAEVFPAYACAGYDCLANKGMLMALISVPGSSTPIVVSTAHFNSRHSSGVADDRSLYAYKRQWDAARQFLSSSEWHEYPIVFAGDFNVGKSLPRRVTFRDETADLWRANRMGSVHDALRHCRSSACKFPTSAEEALTRAKDWQLFASTKLGSLVAEEIQVPFGRGADGSMLSDHIGYSTTYRLNGYTPIRLAQAVTGRGSGLHSK